MKQLTGAEWDKQRQRLRIRFVENKRDGEFDFKRQHVIDGARLAAAQFVDKECSEAITIKTKAEIDEINQDRTERNLPQLNGTQKHRLRTAIRERMIARKAKELGEQTFADLVRRCNSGEQMAVAAELLKTLK